MKSFLPWNHYFKRDGTSLFILFSVKDPKQDSMKILMELFNQKIGGCDVRNVSDLFHHFQFFSHPFPSVQFINFVIFFCHFTLQPCQPVIIECCARQQKRKDVWWNYFIECDKYKSCLIPHD